MSRPTFTTQRAIAIVEPVCIQSGYELVDLRFTVEQGGWTLRVCIDRPLAADEIFDVTAVPEQRVDLSDCEKISRELSAVLDVEDAITQAYSLEVSSPGIDRPLRTAAHYTRFIGSEAKVTLSTGIATEPAAPNAPVIDRRNFRGTLRAVEGTVVGNVRSGFVLIECDGKTYRLAIDDIDSARLIPDWEAVQRGESGYGPKHGTAAPGQVPAKPKKHKPGQVPGRQRAPHPMAKINNDVSSQAAESSDSDSSNNSGFGTATQGRSGKSAGSR